MERLTIRNSEGVAVLKTPYQCERCGEVIYRLSDYGSGEPIEKLARLEDLEEQRKLPVAVGDFVYKIKYGEIESHKVVKIELEESGIYFKSGLAQGEWPFCTLDNFGKNVFLTREEAEAALKELEGKNEAD